MTFQSLKFLADENIDPELVAFLRSKEIDVIDIKELSLEGSKDADILTFAHGLNRVILTHDDDFGKIIYTQKVSFTGIAYIRPGHFFVEFYIAAFEHLLLQNLDYIYPFILVVEIKDGYFKIRLRNWTA